MQETLVIDIYLTPDAGVPFYTPFDVVRAPYGTKIRWEFVQDNGFRNFLRRFDSPVFEIYFPQQSPFPWRERSTKLRQTSQGGAAAAQMMLAQAQAQKEGDFKYGIRAFSGNNTRLIYDDDPRLIIY